MKEFTESEYKRVIEKMLNEKIKAEDICQGAFKYYSLEKGVEKYHSVYKKCLEK